MVDEEVKKDIKDVLDRGIDPLAPARVADAADSQGKHRTAKWIRSNLAKYMLEVFYGAFKNFLN